MTDASALVRGRCVDRRVLLLPGDACCPRGAPSGCVRAAFSTATPAEMDEALRRLREVLLEERAAAAA